MAAQQNVVSHLLIKVNGADLTPAVQGKLIEASVDQQVHLPHMFQIRLYDPAMELLEQGPFDLAAKVEITAKTPEGKPARLITGEVTALEPEFGEGMIAALVVRGYDLSHRLYRACNTKTYLNVKDSDLAAEIAGKAGLKTQIDATATVYEHIFQCNQSDLHFLQQRAWRIGYECFVEENVLHFRRPNPEKPVAKIAWGADLLAFRPRLTVAEQVKTTQVKGWDAQRKAPIVGQAEQGALHPQVKEGGRGEEWASAFGKSRRVFIDHAVVSQAEADILARARHNEANGAYIEAEGELFRRPDIQAGRVVTIEGLGKRLSGDYRVTHATHVYTSGGLKTSFSVVGARTGLLTEQLYAAAPPHWPGAVTAIVTNTDDPSGWGRVKVKYPWLSEQEESHWARVAAAGAGPESGFASVPAVDDEVVVVFQGGDFDRPIVVGGLWNGKDSVPGAVANAPRGEKPLVRTWRSRTGHAITVYDNANNKLELTTKSGHLVILDDAGRKVTVKSAGGLEIVMDDGARKVKITSNGEIEVAAASALTIKGANVKVEASGNLEMQASGQVTVKGAMISLN
jgi:phage protein D/phage baseplate assembly protein gpV